MFLQHDVDPREQQHSDAAAEFRFHARHICEDLFFRNGATH